MGKTKGMTGKKQSDYQKQRMSELFKGRSISNEQKQKISRTLKEKGIAPKKEFWFKEGHKPYNKGKKLPALIGNNYGFKKGQKAWNYIDGRSKNVGPDRYGDDWDKIRLLVYRRDNFTCQECYATMKEQKRAFHVHHKIPFLISFDNSLNNLITLCPHCHRKIEAIIVKELKHLRVGA